jgi:hypothetical protein
VEHDEPLIRPETRALDAYIQATVDRLLSAGARGGQDDALLFLGNWHDAMPRLIFQDPVLQPVDTRVWGVIKIAATGTGPTAFPTYKHIAKTANVGSEATVARSMAILRATRWLTLCRRVRDYQGRFRGNVYALHDEPLPLADTLHLDQEYMQFLEQCSQHAHARVREVGEAVLGTIEDDVSAGRVVTEPVSPMGQRLDAQRTLQGPDAALGYFFSLSAHRLQKLKSVLEGVPLQNLKPEPLQNLKSERSSSCYLNETATTTSSAADGEHEAGETSADSTRALIIPDALKPDERLLARMYVKHAPAALRQDVLDELAGRLRATKSKGEPIGNPVGYLAQLCKAASAGAFKLTSLGLQVQQARKHDAHLKRVNELSRERAAAHMQELLDNRRWRE